MNSRFLTTTLTILLTLPEMMVYAGDAAVAASAAAKEPDSLAKAQAQAQHQEMQKKYDEGRRAMTELERQKALAMQALRSKAKFFEDGMEVLRRYDVLVTTRYVDPAGKFVSGKELTAEDVKTVNQIFQSYFRSSPLEGRISAGHARKVLKQGMEQLAEVRKIHESPSEENSPELEIFAQQIKDLMDEEQRLMMLAERLGMPINTQFVFKDAKVAEPARAPASKR
jgi:hypothetical protein